MLTGKSVFLRALEPSDIDILYHWENEPELWHLSNTAEPFSRFKLEQFILNADQDIFSSKQLRLMICLTVNNNPVGNIDLFDFDPLNHRAGVGIMLDPGFRNKKLASEALEILITYCFEILQLRQLYCNIIPDNNYSMKLFTGRGFQVNGTKKDWIFKQGKWMDECFLQLLNPQYPSH